MNRPRLRAALAASTLLLAGFCGGCVGGADDVAGATTAALALQPLDVFGTRFLVNGSTSPPVLTTMGTVTLAVVDAAVTSADFYDGLELLGSVSASQPSLDLFIDDQANGTHSYSAQVHSGASAARSASVALTVAIGGGGLDSSYANFDDGLGGNGVTFPGPLLAVVTRRNGSVVLGGQTVVNGHRSATFVDTNLHPTHGHDSLARESGWSAVAADPRTGARVLAGYAVNGGQRDLVVTADAGFGPNGPLGDAFHVEYDAARMNDEAFGVAVSAHDSSIVVVGYETRPAQGRAGWITKYSATGTILWTQRLVTDGRAPAPDAVVNAVAIDANDDSIVVAGARVARVEAGVPGGFLRLAWMDVPFVDKYAADGTLLWSKLDAPLGITRGEAKSVSVVPNGDIVWSGCELNGTDPWCVIEKLSAAGASRWRYGDYGRQSILTTVDPLGSVYFQDVYVPDPRAVPPPYNTFKLSSDGKYVWQAFVTPSHAMTFNPVSEFLVLVCNDAATQLGLLDYVTP